MGWVNNSRPHLADNTRVRLESLEGVVDGYAFAAPPDFVGVLFDGADYTSYIHHQALEVFEPEVKAPEYTGTNWHVCSKTGDLFYFSQAEGWFICVNNMVPPLHWDSEKEARVKDLKRLYREA